MKSAKLRTMGKRRKEAKIEDKEGKLLEAKMGGYDPFE